MIITEKINKKIEELSLTPLSGSDINSDTLLYKCYFGMWSEVNGWLEKQFTPGKVGTDFKILGFGKDGDYDFTLVGLTLIAKKWGDKLSQKAKDNLINNLLTQKGNNLLPEKWGIWNLIPESENHLILANSSLYLTNEILFESTGDVKYDNLKNGVHIWMINYLKNIIKNGLYEYNAKPYSSWTIRGLQNLYSYTTNVEMKTATKILLDQLFFKYAVQSKNGHLIVPYRRRENYLVDEIRKNDEFATWLMAFTSYIPDNELENFESIKHDFSFLLTTKIQDYRPPTKFIEICLNDKTLWSKCKHTNLEITYKERNFALFSGGHEDNMLYLIPSPNDATVRVTCLLLNDNSHKVSQLIRFEPVGGFWWNKNNTGVYKNFACGANFILPNNFYIKKSTIINMIDYTFLETDDCYIVIRTLKNPVNLTDTLKNVGCFEVVNKSEFNDFEEFYNKVIELNQNTKITLTDECKHNTTRGYTITFNCVLRSNNWLIQKVEKNGILIEDGNSSVENWQYLYVETNDGFCVAHSNVGGISYSEDGYHYSSTFSEDIPQILNYKMT